MDTLALAVSVPWSSVPLISWCVGHTGLLVRQSHWSTGPLISQSVGPLALWNDRLRCQGLGLDRVHPSTLNRKIVNDNASPLGRLATRDWFMRSSGAEIALGGASSTLLCSEDAEDG